MDNTLEKVDEFLHISKRMRTTSLQSVIGGMTLSIVGMIIAALGFFEGSREKTDRGLYIAAAPTLFLTGMFYLSLPRL